MPTYITLVSFTDQGIRSVRDTMNRTDRAAEIAEKHGGRLEHVYWTVGPYDIIGIFQAPDDETFAAIGLEIGAAGNVRTTTLRAFGREEMSGIIDRLG